MRSWTDRCVDEIRVFGADGGDGELNCGGKNDEGENW